jgi:hypothetical protein
MKEIEQKTKDNVKIVNQAEVKKKAKFFWSLRPNKGQKVFELDLETRIVSLATFQEVSIVTTGKLRDRGVHKKLVMKDNCVYNVALNLENSKRKFLNTLKKSKSNA